MAVSLSVLSINPQKRVLLGPEGKRDELVGDRREARERQCAVDELLDDVEGIKGSLFSLQSEQRNGERAAIHRDERADLPAAHSPREQPHAKLSERTPNNSELSDMKFVSHSQSQWDSEGQHWLVLKLRNGLMAFIIPLFLTTPPPEPHH